MRPSVARALLSRDTWAVEQLVKEIPEMDKALPWRTERHSLAYLLSLDRLEYDDAINLIEALRRTHAALAVSYFPSAADEAFLADACTYDELANAPPGEPRTAVPPLPAIQVSPEATVRHWCGRGRGWHAQVLRLYLFHYLCATRSGLLRVIDEIPFEPAPAIKGIPDNPLQFLIDMRAPKRVLTCVTLAIQKANALLELQACGVHAKHAFWTTFVDWTVLEKIKVIPGE